MNIIKCRIADFKVLFETDMQYYHKFMRDYIDDFNEPNISINLSHEDICIETNYNNELTFETRPAFFKRFAFFRKFSELIPRYNSFIFHSACFDVEGVGVAFAAHSGTGKTTHMNLWQEYLGDKMTVVNGDKPIVRFFDDEPETPYAYGTPWNGKEHLGTNMRTKLKHICFIERSETNYVEKVDRKAVIDRIFKQVYMPKDPVAIAKTMQLTDRLLSCCNLWIIHCNMDIEAAEVAYNTIFEGK